MSNAAIKNADGSPVSRKQVVELLEQIASNEKASSEDRERAREMLEEFARKGGAEAERAVDRLSKKDALRARMGLPTLRATGVHLDGRAQVFPAMTPYEARALIARKGRRQR